MSVIESCDWNRLSPDSTLNPFECSKQDLTEFFRDDSSLYGHHLLAVTYTFEIDNEVAAYYCVSNDKVSREDANTRGEERKLEKPIPHPKRMKSYPAVKVGRLAVNSKYVRQGLGSDILDLIKHSFTTGNKTGCRFITVDALNEGDVLDFYGKNGFIFLTENDEEDKTRLMYFDLVKFKPPD